MLMAGQVPIYEPGLPELLAAQLKAGSLRFSTSYEKAAAFGDVHFICTGTPQLPGGEGADLSQVRACVTALAPLARESSLLVGKSTVPVGTSEALSRDLAAAGYQVEIAWNPEFLREGSRHRHAGPRPDRRRGYLAARRGPAEKGLRAASRRRHQRQWQQQRQRRQRRHAVLRHDAGDRRAVEGGRERLPGHEDLVHQRDGRGVRGIRRQRAGPGGDPRRRPADRRFVPAGRPRVRRRLPAEGHQGVHGHVSRAGRGLGRRAAARGGEDQPAAPVAHRRPGA